MHLPTDFISRIKPLLKEEWDDFASAMQQESQTSIRLNKAKFSDYNLTDRIKWCTEGYCLNERPQFTFDPILHVGGYYVQEASSMFVKQAVEQYVQGDVRFLDLCAAPGGKSTLIASSISEMSLLISNEVVRSRANILAENITKWGLPNVVVSNNDPSKIGKLKCYFDAILVDAPCSGEGMFRKDADVIDEWSVDNVKLCKERQQRILADIWPSLKPGGILIYSTCTYNREENEDNVLWIRDSLGAEVLPVETEKEWGISPSYVEDIPAYHFFPHKVKGEGFFIAVLRKLDETNESPINKKKRAKNNIGVKPKNPDFQNYLINSDLFFINEDKDKYYAFPKVFNDDLVELKSSLNIIYYGICLGQLKGKDFIPDQSLALSTYLNITAFNVCEIDWRTSISFLKKEMLVLENQPRGYILLTYKNMPLGFVKNIGNRANNLYPNEWRIRSNYIPDKEVAL